MLTDDGNLNLVTNRATTNQTLLAGNYKTISILVRIVVVRFGQ